MESKVELTVSKMKTGKETHKTLIIYPILLVVLCLSCSEQQLLFLGEHQIKHYIDIEHQLSSIEIANKYALYIVGYADTSASRIYVRKASSICPNPVVLYRYNPADSVVYQTIYEWEYKGGAGQISRKYSSSSCQDSITSAVEDYSRLYAQLRDRLNQEYGHPSESEPLRISERGVWTQEDSWVNVDIQVFMFMTYTAIASDTVYPTYRIRLKINYL